MRIINRHCFLLIILTLISPFITITTTGQDREMIFNPSDSYREKLIISTDRDIYITGEQVHLKAVELDDQDSIPSGLSKVVYLELLDISNNPVNQIKIRIEGTSGSAAFRLSDTLSSGNYLIMTYTSWMQNFGEDLFSYNTITVINPFKDISNLIAPDSGPPGDKSLSDTKTYILASNKETRDQIKIITKPDKNTYGTRERVKIDISVTDSDGKPFEAGFSVSVVKSFLKAGQKYLTGTMEDNAPVNPSPEPPFHLPELEGELVRGVIYNRTTYEPLKETDISLSFVGKTARCQFVRTNTKGEFIFVVKDRSGPQEIVIQPVNPGISGIYVELDQPFSGVFNGFRSAAFIMNESIAETLNNAVISMQVNNIYDNIRNKKNAPITVESKDFFGKCDRSVDMADYIELDNIREVVKEILPEVVLFRKERQPALKVVSSNPYQIFENQALVLFDGVPVYNIEKLLDVSAKELERIDIINSRYFYGDYIFEGIISFISKKGDLSAIESNNSVFRQLYDGCQLQESFYSPDYSIDSVRSNRIPDFRNTLYWNPDVKISGDGTAKVEFYTSDERMEYMIVVDGFTSDGRRIYLTTPLVVN